MCKHKTIIKNNKNKNCRRVITICTFIVTCVLGTYEKKKQSVKKK